MKGIFGGSEGGENEELRQAGHDACNRQLDRREEEVVNYLAPAERERNWRRLRTE